MRTIAKAVEVGNMKNQILQGNAIDIIKKISVESINCIVTSPPYYGLRDYDLPPTDWAEVSYAPMPGLPPLIIPPMACCLGSEDSVEAYVGHMVLVFRELWKVLRGDGVAWLNLGDSYANSPKGSIVTNKSTLSGSQTYQANGTPPKLLDKTKIGLKQKDLIGIPWRVAFALRADGWYLRNDIIWHKPSAIPESVGDRCTKSHEYIFLLTKKARYWYDQDAIREPHKKESIKRDQTGYKAAFVGRHTMPGDNRPHSDNHNGFNHPLGRNKRTVWTVPPKPYKGAHFATFPPALIEPCILAGCPSRVCVECDESWVRVVERRKADATRPRPFGKKGNDDRNDTLRIYEEHISVKIGFAPTCQCNAPHRPGVVLDPFFGAGTVGVAARQLKRNWLGIELNADYIEMALERLNQTQPALFPR
jgi:DNA modification methylase